MFNSIDSALRVFTKVEKRLQRAIKTNDARSDRDRARAAAIRDRVTARSAQSARAEIALAKIRDLVN